MIVEAIEFEMVYYDKDLKEIARITMPEAKIDGNYPGAAYASPIACKWRNIYSGEILNELPV